ncbi:MAG: hypothetical protein M1827_001468 [Pycnora praestabilis]|nr:MAG: hypothetical protein M1827_001468 [Pycnora praestabilis]
MNWSGPHVSFFREDPRLMERVGRNAPMFRSRGTRGRGVGLARGRATVNRARGQQRDLTGSTPALDTATTSSTAGLSHSFQLSTAYYTATIPIWIDEFTSEPNAFTGWSTEFLKPEAKEVLRVLGSLMFCFKTPIDVNEFVRLHDIYLDSLQTDLPSRQARYLANMTPTLQSNIRSALSAIAQVRDRGCGPTWDGTCLAVSMPTSVTPVLERNFEEWEDLCREFGFEFVEGGARGRNEFGEPVGVARIKEALEANDWAADNNDDYGNVLLGLDSSDDEGSNGGFGAEAAEVEREVFGMRSAIHSNGEGDEGQESDKDRGDTDFDEGDEELQVEQLEAMMLRVQAVKDMSAAMPKAARKKFAAKAVDDMMKTL